MIPRTARQILRNMRVYQPSLAAANFGDRRLAKARLAFAEGFDLGADQDEPCLELVAKSVVVGRRAVLRDDLDAFVLLFLLGRFHESDYHSRRGRDDSQVADLPRVPRPSRCIHAVRQQKAAMRVLVSKYGNAGICCRITERVLDFRGHETADFGGRFCFVETV